MSIFYNPYDDKPKYNDAVVRTWIAEYEGGEGGAYSDQYATAWDASTREFVEVCCGSLDDLYGTQPFEDASPEVMAEWNALPEALRATPTPPLRRLGRLGVHRWRNAHQHAVPDRFGAALALASRLHRPQFRKGTAIPYVSHLLAVAAIALEFGATEDEAIGALLHDAIEDQGGEETGALIRAMFGDRVYDIVTGCSDTAVVPKPPWEDRKRRYIEHVKDAPDAVKMVSAADKLHNARATVADVRAHGEEVWSRFNAPKKKVLWYYAALVEAFRANGPDERVVRVVDELERTVEEMRELATGARGRGR